MATLEKIRSKSVLLLIIIGVALLAFIIGDFFNSSRSFFGPDLSVAKIDGDDIDPQEYQKRREGMQAGETDELRAYADQQALMQVVLERLSKEEYEKLGLTVTDDELNDAVNGKGHLFADILAAQYAQNRLNMQVASAAQLFDLTQNPAKYGLDNVDPKAMKQMWVDYEEALASALNESKFFSMLSGTMVTNKLDLAQNLENRETGYMISYVMKPYGVDPSVTVSDADIQAAYNAEKSRFTVDEETRLVSYIQVPIRPSVEDEDAARALIKEVTQGLATTEGAKALQGRKGFDYNQSTMTNAAIDQLIKQGAVNASFKSFADSAAIGSAAIINDGPQDFQIAKLLGRGTAVDSLTFNVVFYDLAQAGLTDSLKSAIAQGKTAAELQMIAGVQGAIDSIATSITTPQVNQIIAADLQTSKDAFLTTAIGQAFAIDSVSNASNNGLGRMYTVVNRKAPQSNIEYLLVSYRLNPSRATIDKLRTDLEKFVAANSTAAKFDANAAASNYALSYGDVSASAPYIVAPNLQTGQQMPVANSYKVAVWALEASNGNVSGVFGGESTGFFTAAALNDIYTTHRTTSDPMVKSYFTQKVRNAKTAEKMLKQYAGKATDLEGYAQLMGVEVATDAVNMINGSQKYGAELLGKIVSSPVGKMSAPEKGNDGIIVYTVTEIKAPTRTLNMLTDAGTLATPFTAAQNMFKLLLGKRTYENRLLKVFKEN